MKTKVSVVICTMNEESVIGKLLKEIPKGYEKIVVDKSKDKTVEIAKKAGAKVIKQRSKGKGNAMKMGVRIAKGDIIAFIDGDGTNPPKEIPKLVSLILNDKADMVIGVRIPKKGAMKLLHKFGNWVFSKMASIFYYPTKDLLSGMRVIKKTDFLNLGLESKGFEIETEIFIKSYKKGLRIREIPTSYNIRYGDSKLNAIREGLKVLKTIFKYLS